MDPDLFVPEVYKSMSKTEEASECTNGPAVDVSGLCCLSWIYIHSNDAEIFLIL